MTSDLSNLYQLILALDSSQQQELLALLEKKLRPLKTDIARASESTFAKVWDNDDDAAYDKL